MLLSPRLTLDDLTKSGTAIRNGIDNTPDALATENLKALCTNVLEPIITYYGTLHIESGYRSAALNKKVRGSQNSQHLTGEAADIEVRNISNHALIRWIRDNLTVDQAILEFHDPAIPDSGWVHVSYSRTRNRRHVLEAVKQKDGKTKYLPFI